MTTDLSLYAGNRALVSAGLSGALLEGPFKTAQRFANAFITEKGTAAYDTDYGSEFMTYVKLGLIRTDFDVVAYFNQTSADVVRYIKSQETAATPSNEAIDKVTLDHFELELPSLLLYATISTLDGTTAEVVLPISTVTGD